MIPDTPRIICYRFFNRTWALKLHKHLKRMFSISKHLFHYWYLRKYKKFHEALLWGCFGCVPGFFPFERAPHPRNPVQGIKTSETQKTSENQKDAPRKMIEKHRSIVEGLGYEISKWKQMRGSLGFFPTEEVFPFNGRAHSKQFRKKLLQAIRSEFPKLSSVGKRSTWQSRLVWVIYWRMPLLPFGKLDRLFWTLGVHFCC